MEKAKTKEVPTGKRLLESEQYRKEVISIPRHALGKYPGDLLCFIFGLLPDFSNDKGNEVSLILTESELLEKTALYGQELRVCISKINEMNLFSIQEKTNNSYKITIHNKEMDDFIREVTSFTFLFVKTEEGKYLEDKRLSLGSIGLLTYLLENEEIKSITNELDFAESLSKAKTDSFDNTICFLRELRKYGYFHDFDIVNKLTEKIVRRVQVVANCSMDMKEVKTFLSPTDNEAVYVYPIGEVM